MSGIFEIYLAEVAAVAEREAIGYLGHRKIGLDKQPRRLLYLPAGDIIVQRETGVAAQDPVDIARMVGKRRGYRSAGQSLAAMLVDVVKHAPGKIVPDAVLRSGSVLRDIGYQGEQLRIDPQSREKILSARKLVNAQRAVGNSRYSAEYERRIEHRQIGKFEIFRV